MPDATQCARTDCRAPRCIDRVTTKGRIRWSAWCTTHRQEELAKLAAQRRSTDQTTA